MEELQRLGGTHGVAKLLACETAVGLLDHASGGASIESRHTSFGINKLPDAKPESFWMLLVGRAGGQTHTSNTSGLRSKDLPPLLPLPDHGH